MQTSQSYGQPPVTHMQSGPQPMMQPPTRVVVTDIDMKFGTMIVFMVKWAIAAIPATLILSIIGGAIMAVFFVLLGALGVMAGAASH